MVSFKYPLSMVLILLTTLSVDAKRDYSVDLLDISSKVSDVDFFKFLNHSLTNEKMGNFHFMLDQNVTEWSVKLNFDILTKGNRRMNLLKTAVDGCQIIKSSSQNKIISIVINEILRTSNIPRKCPFVEHVLYSIKNYTVNDDNFPAVLPATSWQFDLNSIMNKMFSFNVTIKGRVRKL